MFTLKKNPDLKDASVKQKFSVNNKAHIGKLSIIHKFSTSNRTIVTNMPLTVCHIYFKVHCNSELTVLLQTIGVLLTVLSLIKYFLF